MYKFIHVVLLAVLLLTGPVVSAQDFSSRRNDDAATLSVQPNRGAAQAVVNRYGEAYTIARPGLETCSAANTGTTAVTIVAASAANSHYVSRLRCSNNSTTASLFSTAGLVQTGLYIGNTTLGNNTLTVEYPNPIKVAANTAVTFTMATTATSTICCVNYKTYPNP